jgi:predicted TIM-barrel fold metal-dependent hydrolase
MTRISCVVATALLLLPAVRLEAQDVPAVDHHQHLISPSLAALSSATPPGAIPPLTAAELIGHLDAAGIRRAVVLSTAYIWSQPSRKVADDAAHVRADNDWTSQQVALYPDRLVGFCGLNPLRDYALDELKRCASDPNLRHGVKLHFGNSVVDYHNATQIAQVRRVFSAANGYRMPIVVHMRASVTEKLPYGRDEALVFLTELVPAAPDVPIQIAHLAGAGGYADPAIDQALAVFVEAIQRHDPSTTRLWFDISGVALGNPTVDQANLIATRIRQLGIDRVLYGTDTPVPGNSPREAWAAFKRLPLTDAEFRTIAANVAPYLR